MSELRIGQQQIVEIAKALAQDVRILIMDEPTSALSTAEVEVLFRVIRELQAHGVSIIYISHKLDELLQIGDYVTVLRDGKRMVEAATGGRYRCVLDHREDGGQATRRRCSPARNTRLARVLLRVENLTLPRMGGGYVVDHVTFELHAGEILGLLWADGRRPLRPGGLPGRRPAGSYRQIWLNGRSGRWRTGSRSASSPAVLVPEDRQRDGLVQTMSVAHNMLLASLKKYLNRFYPGPQEGTGDCPEVCAGSVHPGGQSLQSITRLSGGQPAESGCGQSAC